ncbi:hypothetical protein V6N12_031398 [Hibiscus sabdariffa]|uniref:Uncharacterized protein n=1 Tax=Hibiscus sabdariffa TaxID=183260 RepID=A0ABR2B1T9_9ROSI
MTSGLVTSYNMITRLHSLNGFAIKPTVLVVMMCINHSCYQKLCGTSVGSAVKCATALLQGETGLKLDIKCAFSLLRGEADLIPVILPDTKYKMDLDHELYKVGAVLCTAADIGFKGQLPLNIAIEHISEQPSFTGWSTRQSLYMTIVFCQCETKLLDIVELLFRATNKAEAVKEIYLYVKDGKLIEIAALLTLAREEFTSPNLFKGLCDPALNGSMSLRQLVLSEIVSLMASQIGLVSASEEVHDELNNKLETMMFMLRLIEVFERVGGKIRLYRQYLTKLSKEELAAQMAFLLITEGFAEYKDFELKRSIPCARVTQFHKDFLELLKSKLSCENEGTQLKSETAKIYREHVADAMPLNLEAIQILNNEDDAKGSLALRASLEKLCYHPYLNDWTPKKSIFKLVCILCLPQLKESLESVRLAACKTEIEAIGCDLARQGKLIELASLLMVAPEKLIITASPGSNDLCSNAIRRCIMSDLQASLNAEVRLTGRRNSHSLVEKCKDEKEMKLSALLLLEVFERAGNSINQFIQSDAYKDGTRSRLEIVREIQNLLDKAGFVMKPKDTDLNDIKCFSPTLDPVDRTSMPLALGPHVFSVAEGNSKCCRPRVSAPKSKAVKPGIPNASRKSMGWFLSLWVDISKAVKRI